MPFLSVITVVFNEVETIERTIKSVISQGSIDIEYIVIDGGSDDGTVEIIKRYDSYISWWISERDKGIYDAMNKGIRVATGEWISFLNGNDWYKANAIERIRLYAGSSKALLLYGYVDSIKDNRFDGYIGISKPANPEELYLNNLYCHQGLFIKRELFEKFGLYDTQYKVFADHDWLLRVHECGYDPQIMGFTVASFTRGGVSSIHYESDEDQVIMIRHYRKHKLFSKEIDRKKGRADFLIMKRHLPELFFDLFNVEGNLYLWGNGKNGAECLEILKQNNIAVRFIITSNLQTDNWNGVKVVSDKFFFDDVVKKDKSDYRIIIATAKYEDEICNMLNNSNIQPNKYIRMTDIYIWACEHNTIV